MKDQRQPTPGERVERMFARRLRELRAERGLSQAALAEKVNNLGLKMDDLTILRIEKNDDGPEGGRRVRLGEATLIAKALGVRLDEMLRETRSTEVRAQELQAELAALHAALLNTTEQVESMQTRREALVDRIELVKKSIDELGYENNETIPGYIKHSPAIRLLDAAKPDRIVLNRELRNVVRPLLRERFWWTLTTDYNNARKASELREIALRAVAPQRLGYHPSALDALERTVEFARSDTTPTLGSALEVLHRRLVLTSRTLVEAAVDLLDSKDSDDVEKANRFREELRQFLSATDTYLTNLVAYIVSNPSKEI